MKAGIIRKRILLIVCLFVSSVLFGGAENALGNEKKITITDALNRVVTIKQPVRRFAYTGICLTDALKGSITGLLISFVGRI